MTSNDVFKQAELIKRKEVIAEMEKDENMCETIAPLDEKAALILQEGQDVENLHANDFKILLRWCQVQKATVGKVEVKRMKWQDILDSRTTKIYKKW